MSSRKHDYLPPDKHQTDRAPFHMVFKLRSRHSTKTFSALLALCEGNPPVNGGFPSQRASNAAFDIFFDVSLYKQLNKLPCAGDWRRHGGHCDVTVMWVVMVAK